MFLYFFPLGVSSVKKLHVWLAWAMIAILFYRAAMSFIFPQLQIPITAYFLNTSFNMEFFSAAVQSLITPSIWPGWASAEHRFFCFVGTVALFIFWLLFASSFEMRLGKKLFLALILFGFVATVTLASIPILSLNPTFWIGQVVTMLFVGIAFGMFATDDVRIYYHYYILFGEHNIGTWEVPAFAPLIVLAILMFVPMSTFWYANSDLDVPIRFALIGPLGWTSVVVITGVGIGVLTQYLLNKQEAKYSK